MNNWADSTIVKLKIISKLSEHDKLCFRSDGVRLDPPKQWRWAWRTFYGDGRDGTLQNLQEIYNTVFMSMRKYMNETSTSPKVRKIDFYEPGIYSDESFKLFGVLGNRGNKCTLSTQTLAREILLLSNTTNILETQFNNDLSKFYLIKEIQEI